MTSPKPPSGLQQNCTYNILVYMVFKLGFAIFIHHPVWRPIRKRTTNRTTFSLEPLKRNCRNADIIDHYKVCTPRIFRGVCGGLEMGLVHRFIKGNSSKRFYSWIVKGILLILAELIKCIKATNLCISYPWSLLWCRCRGHECFHISLYWINIHTA